MYRIGRGEIFLASYYFPHEEKIVTKQRPVLVLQCNAEGEKIGDEKYCSNPY